MALVALGCNDYGLNGDGPTSTSPPPLEGWFDVPFEPQACNLESEGPAAVADRDQTCTDAPAAWSGLELAWETIAARGDADARVCASALTLPVDGFGEAVSLQSARSGTREVVGCVANPGTVLWSGTSPGEIDEIPAAYLAADGGLVLGILTFGAGQDEYSPWREFSVMYDETEVSTVAVRESDGDATVSAAFAGEPWWLADGQATDMSEVIDLYGSQFGLDSAVSFTDLDGDTLPELLGSAGICSLSSRSCTPWTTGDGEALAAQEVAALGLQGEVVIAGTSEGGAFLASSTGVVSFFEGPVTDREGFVGRTPLAVADVTGDGDAELCIVQPWTGRVLNPDGSALASWRRGEFGTCVMADLDADASYEVIDVDEDALRIMDGTTGAVRASADHGLDHTGVSWFSLQAADVLPGGGMEVMVMASAENGGESSLRLRIYRPATGDWSRGRPVWNQHAYDITSIHDDGTLAPFPRPPWQSYNAHRAQPAHDGDRPDLVPELVDVCADSCAAGGTILASARVANLGGEPSAGGAELRLHALHGDQWVQVASASFGGTIDEGTTTATALLEFPYEQRGTRHVLEVVAAPGEDECDMVNDRVEVEISPCGE